MPLVLDSPHSGDDYPADFDHRAAARRASGRPRTRTSTRSTRARRRIGATLIEALFPRALHRSQPAPGRHRPGAARGRVAGAARAVAQDRAGHRARVARSRTAASRCTRASSRRPKCDARIDRCYEPYHAALDGRARRAARAFGAVWHINCHSMPAVGDVMSDDPGRARADFVLGDRDGTTCEPGVHRVRGERRCGGSGYDVAINDPYKGVELVRKHGRPARAPAQPADRNQSPPVHGRNDALPGNAGFRDAARRHLARPARKRCDGLFSLAPESAATWANARIRRPVDARRRLAASSIGRWTGCCTAAR